MESADSTLSALSARSAGASFLAFAGALFSPAPLFSPGSFAALFIIESSKSSSSGLFCFPSPDKSASGTSCSFSDFGSLYESSKGERFSSSKASILFPNGFEYSPKEGVGSGSGSGSSSSSISSTGSSKSSSKKSSSFSSKASPIGTLSPIVPKSNSSGSFSGSTTETAGVSSSTFSSVTGATSTTGSSLFFALIIS